MVGYFKSQNEDNDTNCTPVRDDAKVFEYKEDADIVASLIAKLCEVKPTVGVTEIQSEPVYGDDTNYNFIVKFNYK